MSPIAIGMVYYFSQHLYVRATNENAPAEYDNILSEFCGPEWFFQNSASFRLARFVIDFFLHSGFSNQIL